MWFCVILYWCVVANICFQYCIECLFVCHEGTDTLAEIAEMDADIPQEGVAIPSSHDHDYLWIHFDQKEFHGKPWPNGLGTYLFVLKSQSLFSKVYCTWPQGFDCYLRGDCCFLMLYPDRVHWCVTCFPWVWLQSNDDFYPDEHRTEVCGCTSLCLCGILYTFFMCA